MLQSASYFERKGKFDKAVELYDQGGNKRKAMDIGMKRGLMDLVKNISSNMGDNEDPEVVS